MSFNVFLIVFLIKLFIILFLSLYIHVYLEKHSSIFDYTKFFFSFDIFFLEEKLELRFLLQIENLRKKEIIANLQKSVLNYDNDFILI